MPDSLAQRLVVTGALGHIGSRFIRALPENRYADVLLVDNLVTQRYCSLFDLPAHVRYRFVEADICAADLEALFAGADTVVHLAAITDATSSFGHRDAIMRVNVAATEQVALACLAAGAHLVFPSTTSVYGTSEQVVDELCPESALQPQSPYAESKLEAERLLQRLSAERGLRVALLRLGTIVGVSAGMRFHTAVNKFAWQACTGQALTVWRTAMHQLRPYLEIEDAVRALSFVIERQVADQIPYNVVTANASVSEIIEMLRRHIPDLHVEMVDSQIMNQLSFEVRADRFRRLGFTYERRLEQGVAETVRRLRYLRPD